MLVSILANSQCLRLAVSDASAFAASLERESVAMQVHVQELVRGRVSASTRSRKASTHIRKVSTRSKKVHFNWPYLLWAPKHTESESCWDWKIPLEVSSPSLLSRLLRAMFRWVLNIFKDGDSTASLSNLLQYLTSLTVKVILSGISCTSVCSYCFLCCSWASLRRI